MVQPALAIADPAPTVSQSLFAPFSRHRNLPVVLLYQVSPFAGDEGSPASEPRFTPAVDADGVKVCLLPAPKVLAVVVRARFAVSDRSVDASALHAAVDPLA